MSSKPTPTDDREAARRRQQEQHAACVEARHAHQELHRAGRAVERLLVELGYEEITDNIRARIESAFEDYNQAVTQAQVHFEAVKLYATGLGVNPPAETSRG
jgi:urease accessory protein UreF